jgi:hypothetical protein
MNAMGMEEKEGQRVSMKPAETDIDKDAEDLDHLISPEERVRIAGYDLVVRATFQIKALPAGGQRLEQCGFAALTHSDQGDTWKGLQVRVKQCHISTFHARYQHCKPPAQRASRRRQARGGGAHGGSLHLRYHRRRNAFRPGEKRPDAKRLHVAVCEFLRCVDVLPWDHAVAEHYGKLRADLEHQGKILAPFDLLIATHALDVGAVLVTNDRAFGQVTGLQVEGWTD